MKPELYPMTFAPVYKDHLWGGRRIAARYGRKPPVDPVAESWEIACLPEGMSLVANGPLAGRTLSALITDYGEALLGAKGTTFPLLIKIIDARKRLSLQVHPSNATAAVSGGNPKTEMWYILAAEPGAQVMSGLKSGVDRERFSQAVMANDAESVVNLVPVQTGDVIFMPGGRVHAIDAGCLLLEVQQASDTTYRVCDWGRVGPDGNPRQLHLDQALSVIDWDDTEPGHSPAGKFAGEVGSAPRALCQCDYFCVDKMNISTKPAQLQTEKRFIILFLPTGSATITASNTTVQMTAGTSCLIPAATEAFSVSSEENATELIRIFCPSPKGKDCVSKNGSGDKRE
jgi:mannose-6-phosphate isomerase